MILQLNASDLTSIIRQGTKGRDFVTVQSVRDNTLVLQMVFPRQVTVTLQHFILQADGLTAEMSPWWVRNLVALYLKWRGDDRIKIDGQHLTITFPEKLRNTIRFNHFTIENDAVFVDFDLRDDVRLV